MDKLNGMTAFAKVVALGSYAEAGRALGLTRSAVSKSVMELEQILGARLLDRTTRRVSATEAGRAYYERCIDILARIEETEHQVSRLHDQPAGTLRMNAPMSFGVRHLAPILADFMASHPNLKLELTLNDRFIDPIEEGFDVTIRIGVLADSSLIARRLAPARRVLVASPSYLDSHGEPAHPEDLAQHRCLSYGHTTALQRWQLMHDGRPERFAINSVLCSNNGDVLRTAAIAGQGIALLPTFLVGPDITAKRLRVVLPKSPAEPLAIFAIYAPNRYLAAKTRLVIDHLAARLGETPDWESWDNPKKSRKAR